MIAALILGFLAPELRVLSARPAPEIDALFQRTDGWIGGDGAFSVPMRDGRVAWLFSDTWVGKVREGHRIESTMVNNTVGIQRSAFAAVEFTVARDDSGMAKAFITPKDHRGWFWLQAGGMVDGKLLQFFNQVEKTGEPGVWGFRSAGLWMGITENPQDEPAKWRTVQTKLPNVVFSPERTLTWGSSVLVEGSSVYIYGTEDIRRNGRLERYLVLAHADKRKLSDTRTWKYYDGAKWSSDIGQVGHLADGFATEHSITRFDRGYLAVYTENGLSSRILGRFSKFPWGPWSRPTTLYNCPEMGSIANTFTYAAKAHASLSRRDEVTLSYVVNAGDIGQVVRDATLYWPRFVIVRLARPR